MKWIKNIDDYTNHIFTNKERKAKAIRNAGDLLKPREVYLSCCSLIAENLVDSGFIYLKSSQKLRLESQDKKYKLEIKFLSDRNNVAGEYIEFSGYFSINSVGLQKFGIENPLINYWTNVMFAHDLGALINPEKGNIIWNIAIDEDFNLAIDKVVDICRGKLLRIFNQLQDCDLVIDQISKGEFELQSLIGTVQYLLSYSKIDLANKYLTDIVKRYPEKIMTDYFKAKIEFESNGLPTEYVMGYGYGYDLALIEIVYGLKITVPNK